MSKHNRYLIESKGFHPTDEQLVRQPAPGHPEVTISDDEYDAYVSTTAQAIVYAMERTIAEAKKGDTTMGGKPSRGTPADKRLAANKQTRVTKAVTPPTVKPMASKPVVKKAK